MSFHGYLPVRIQILFPKATLTAMPLPGTSSLTRVPKVILFHVQKNSNSMYSHHLGKATTFHACNLALELKTIPLFNFSQPLPLLSISSFFPVLKLKFYQHFHILIPIHIFIPILRRARGKATPSCGNDPGLEANTFKHLNFPLPSHSRL